MISMVTVVTLCTIRIESVGNSPGVSVGTGYFYNLPDITEEVNFPVIITNKHVVEGMHTATLQFQIAPAGKVPNEDGTVEGEQRWVFTLPLNGAVILHPDPNVDLCAIAIASLLDHLPAGMHLCHPFLDSRWRLSSEEQKNTRPIEPILMVGYPNGLWDEVNNKPITRQGSTASHPLRSWNGERSFVIDAACFGGSSGSPVFLYEDGWYRDKENSYAPGTKIKLLGTLYAGPQVTAEGRLVTRPIPTSAIAVPQINLMMNLGYVIHANAIDDLAHVFQQQYRLHG